MYIQKRVTGFLVHVCVSGGDLKENSISLDIIVISAL